MLNELVHLKNYLKEHDSVVLAVVIETWGSAPRRPGSVMVINPEGVFEGSVSGGCVEGNVITEAQKLTSTQSPGNWSKQIEFSVATEEAWQVGLACGGNIKIGLFTLQKSTLEALEKAISALENRQFGTLILEANHVHFETHDDVNRNAKIQASDEILSLPINVSPRLVIIGAVHIAQHLTALADECGMQTLVIDPREAFTNSRAFGEATIINDWPDDYFTANPPDAGTAIITLTHDPKLDDAALVSTLDSKAFYFGSLGSRKTHVSRLDRLKGKGFQAEQLDKINGPVGLDIGAANPAEIAVSILAEIVGAWRSKVEI